MQINSIVEKYSILLGSKSPRRQDLLQQAAIPFRLVNCEVDEIYPAHLQAQEIPCYLSELKAKAYQPSLKENELLITADTIVWLDGKVLGKPQSQEDATQMLQQLSGKCHTVYTGFTISSKDKSVTDSEHTKVFFRELSTQEIEYYVHTYRPMDKAGSYGVQEWIGMVGVTHIQGCYYNIMGLPVQKVYQNLLHF